MYVCMCRVHDSLQSTYLATIGTGGILQDDIIYEHSYVTYLHNCIAMYVCWNLEAMILFCFH